MKSRISKPSSELKSHYSVVVIGSGYGGSIAASRMARAGQSVCLLEKGKEIRPGDYPDKELEAVKEVHVDAAGNQIGKENALYQFAVNHDISVFHGCGLGGTSLVNANVSLPPEDWVLQDPRWPKEIRTDIPGLLSEIEKAKKVLEPAIYPTGKDGYPVLPKVEAQRKSAELTGGDFQYTPINVQFKDGLNAAGYHQNKCNNCGDCVTGCNVGAKNTTLMNYLPDAANHGAEIFTEISVSHLTQNDEKKWLIYYSVMESGSDKFSSAEQFVTADFVFLGAGALGSTKILLQSRAKGLTTSDQLGKAFTGNGDALGFAYNADQQISGLGLGHYEASEKRVAPGPCIASVIDKRVVPVKEDGMVIEEGVIPGALSAMMTAAFLPLSRIFGKNTDKGFVDFLKEKGRELKSLFSGPYTGAVKNTQTFLVMSHDDGKGEMSLADGRLKIDWPDVGEQSIFKKVSENLRLAAKALGANYLKNPAWNKLMDYSLVTVHPLGGCIMGDDASKGVVNHQGQVFTGTAGDEVYSNLLVCDGAIIPRPLGVNPLLTISGLAERICTLTARDNGWQVNDQYKEFGVESESLKPGIQFTESMTGYLSKTSDEAMTYAEARDTGKEQENDFRFILTIQADDAGRFLEEADHEAAMFGTVTCKSLSANTISVKNGNFNLFVKDEGQVASLQMKYSMQMHTEEGEAYYFQGYKEVRNDPGFDVWHDLTTLFIDIYKGNSNEGELVAKGILKIKVADFKRQMQTIKALNTDSKKESLKWIYKFSKFFAGNVTEVYGGVFNKINLFNPDAPAREERKLDAPEPTAFPFQAKDGIDLLLTRYKGGDKGPLLLIHGFGVSSQIFSIDTIDVNLVEFLTNAGYDIWLIDNRLSTRLSSSENRATGDQVAENDYEPAVELIKRETGKAKVHVIAHCFGSTTFSMALLNGLQDIGSVVISQIGPHVISSPMNVFKSKLYLPDLLNSIGFDKLTAYTDTNDSWKAKFFNSLLKFYPYDKEDKTNDPVSNRITFLYGQLYELDQLNQETFNALHELFGVANIDSFIHLAEMIRAKELVSIEGNDTYMPNLQEHMAMPITFIHGEENACYLPESTELTYQALKEANADIPYERHVIPNYGHIDCIFGKDAAKDVYPFILEHFEKHAQ